MTGAPCPICGKTILRKKNLSIHMITCHPSVSINLEHLANKGKQELQFDDYYIYDHTTCLYTREMRRAVSSLSEPV